MTTSTKTSKKRLSRQYVKDNIFIYIFIITVLVFLYLAFKGWDGSLTEIHDFRQTQTAISVYYMLKGSSLINYQTPVLGFPWSIPIEFPFYQIIVYLFVKLTNYNLDQAGRLVSLMFFCTSLYPLYILIKQYFVDSSRVYIALLLICVSPQYIYWSRTFMIESAALSMSLWYVYFVHKHLRLRNHIHIAASLFCILVVGIIASITKVTTFFVYYIIGIILFSVNTFEIRNESIAKKLNKKNCLIIFFAFIIPLAAIIMWTQYSDYIKSLNPIGSTLTSSSLKKWIYGTIENKIALHTWATIIKRSLSDLLGDYRLFAVIMVLFPFCRRCTLITSAVLLVLYMLPMMVFTNLFYCHNYYVYANGILLLIASALILGDTSTRGQLGYFLSLLIIVIVVSSCINRYWNEYLPVQGTKNRFQDIKMDVITYSVPDDVLVFSGADWSSVMPYYLERRSLMYQGNYDIHDSKHQKARELLNRFRVGGILVCYESRNNQNTTDQLMADYNFEKETIIQKSYDNCNAYFKLDRITHKNR